MIKLVKLVTGEEVLARVEEGDNPSDTVILKNPVKLGLSQKGVAMVPLSPFMKDDAVFSISYRDVIYMIDPDEDVVNGYNQQFGGILTAPPGLKI